MAWNWRLPGRPPCGPGKMAAVPASSTGGSDQSMTLVAGSVASHVLRRWPIAGEGGVVKMTAMPPSSSSGS